MYNYMKVAFQLAFYMYTYILIANLAIRNMIEVAFRVTSTKSLI